MNKPSIWAVIPAAGIGQRMQSDIPKQYLPLAGSTVIENTINRLLAADKVKGLSISLRNDDQYNIGGVTRVEGNKLFLYYYFVVKYIFYHHYL